MRNGMIKFKAKKFRFNSLIKEAYLNRISLSSSGFYARLQKYILIRKPF